MRVIPVSPTCPLSQDKKKIPGRLAGQVRPTTTFQTRVGGGDWGRGGGGSHTTIWARLPPPIPFPATDRTLGTGGGGDPGSPNKNDSKPEIFRFAAHFPYHLLKPGKKTHASGPPPV